MSLINLKQELILYKSLQTIGGLMKSSKQTPRLQELIQILIDLGFNEADINPETNLQEIDNLYNNEVIGIINLALLELENNLLTTEVNGSIIYTPTDPEKHFVYKIEDSRTVLLKSGDFQVGQVVEFNNGVRGNIIGSRKVRVENATNNLIECSLVRWVITHAPQWVKPELLGRDNNNEAQLNVLVKVPNRIPPGTIQWKLYYNNELLAKGRDYSVIGWCYIVKGDAYFSTGTYKLELERLNGVTGEYTWQIPTQTDRLICPPYLIDLT